MKEYIEREALKCRMTFDKEDILLVEGKTFVNFDCVSEAVLNTPTADVAEVRRGRWIKTSYPEVHRCSVCDKPSNTSKGLHKYCPECGAKMNRKRDK